MGEVTERTLTPSGEHTQPAAQLLQLVYNELRKLAGALLALEPSGQTLQPTALVHEAYVRLVRSKGGSDWDNRSHFYAAAAESMRRILIENARRKHGPQHGGHLTRRDLDPDQVASCRPDELLALDEALQQLEAIDPRPAAVVKLRFFGGLTLDEVAETLNVSARTADADWAYARAWLMTAIRGDE